MKNLAVMVLNVILICAITLIGCILFDRYKSNKKDGTPFLSKSEGERKSPAASTPSKTKNSHTDHLTYLQNKSIDLEKQKNNLVKENNQLKNKISVMSAKTQKEKVVNNPDLVNKVLMLDKENKSLKDALYRERQMNSYKEKLNSLKSENDLKKDLDHQQSIERLMKENEDLKSRKCEIVLLKPTPTPKPQVYIVKPFPTPSPTPSKRKVNVKPLPEVKQSPSRVDELN